MPSRSITFIDNNIIVDMVHWVDKKYAWIFDPHNLFDIIARHYAPGKRVCIDCTDGENILFSGIVEFAKNLQQQLNVPKNDLIIKSYFELDLDFATCQRRTSPFIKALVHEFPTNFLIRNSEFDKKFICIQARFSIHRLRLAMHMHQNWRDDTLLGYFLSNDHVEFALRNCQEYFQEELAWSRAHGQILFDGIGTDSTPSMTNVGWQASLSEIIQYYQRYLIDLVVETDTWNPQWITEKTTRSFMLGKPFVLYGAAGALTHLHKLGFKTFTPWINESYDSVTNNRDRFQAVVTEIDRLGNMSHDELMAMAQDMHGIFEHNQYHQKNTNYLDKA